MAGKGLAGDAAYLQGKPCPRCAYVRTRADTGDEWQCPKCHVAYAKTGIAPSVRLPVPIVTEESETDGSVDSSLVALLAANVLVVVLAVLNNMSGREVVLIYLAQGVIIGLANVVRVLNLRRFEFQDNRDAPDPDPDPEFASWLRLMLALGAIMFYMALHASFFYMVMRDVEFYRGVPDDFSADFWLCTFVFACTHTYSLWHNLRADCGGEFGMATVAMIPFFRAMPMLVSPFVALAAPGGNVVIIFFAVFKTLADCYMHRATHRFLRGGRQRLTD